MSVSIKVSNKDRMLAALKNVAPGMEKGIADALVKSADEMVQQAKQFAPVDDGDLRNSIAYTVGKYSADNANVRGSSSGGGSDSSVTVHAGNAKAYYAAFVEFGVPDRPKQPFFFPAFRLLRKRIKGRLSRAMSKAIKDQGFGTK
jgi:HK97 gp10 family phage protein